jgi:glycosyltransferase involved in cell wall biosynthesis
MPNQDPEISIVIPAYNEEARIENTLRRVVDYFDARGEPYEVLVVSDGSTDRTEALVQAFASQHSTGEAANLSTESGQGACGALRHAARAGQAGAVQRCRPRHSY